MPVKTFVPFENQESYLLAVREIVFSFLLIFRFVKAIFFLVFFQFSVPKNLAYFNNFTGFGNSY